jgi:bacillithiol biosynthesis deacetylase BshB1
MAIRSYSYEGFQPDEETVMDLDALAFGAHADDVELGCGGTLIKLTGLGYKTGVVALTRGEMGTRGDAETRAREFDDSARIIGLAAHRMLDIPDGRVEVTWENKLKIIETIRAHRPRIIFAPYWVARHPDHEQTSLLVRQAAYLAGLMKLDTGQPPVRPHKVIYYPSRMEFRPSFIVDISDSQPQKMRAVKAYGSQFEVQGQDAAESDGTLIGRADFLAGVETRDRYYGGHIGVTYGEPFFIRGILPIKDPVECFGPEYSGAIP